ncbi:MAG: serine acetyltransferase [Desulfobacterota bacterium]|nr:serine acetyltransferase [Thermodesulfobacteriota bacterium]MDW8001722.1 serine O-acetyltransferase EpsC [Deltaproteobacteria bacterium]
MSKSQKKKKVCNRPLQKKNYSRAIAASVERMLKNYKKGGRFTHIEPEPIPSRVKVIDIIYRAIELIYPGYHTLERLDENSIRYYFGQKFTELFNILSEQITFAYRHECIRYGKPCIPCDEFGYEVALKFLDEIPHLQEILAKDVKAAYEGDPASKHYDEVIFCYPGLFAITVYRIAHFLHVNGVPLIPRIMTEYAHSRTGIDIHPGAKIGESFFIDHGTGVVIGETTEIGNRVRIYQGVTLGALSLSKEECESLRNKKRHPTIEDDVIIYANATILGGNTVIGRGSIIGGNVWLTESVPPNTEVYLKKPELMMKNRS